MKKGDLLFILGVVAVFGALFAWYFSAGTIPLVFKNSAGNTVQLSKYYIGAKNAQLYHIDQTEIRQVVESTITNRDWQEITPVAAKDNPEISVYPLKYSNFVVYGLRIHRYNFGTEMRLVGLWTGTKANFQIQGFQLADGCYTINAKWNGNQETFDTFFKIEKGRIYNSD